jgi:UDP-N-acetyl-D-glucosamine dehydrogenase
MMGRERVQALMPLLERREAKVAVVGLGYVGLPLALTVGEAGFPVLGFDVDEDKVWALGEGRSYIKTVAPERVQAMNGTGRFGASAEFSRLAEADVVIVCVPTPLTKNREPDMSFVERSAETIARTLRPGQLVVLESSTWPGTTRELVLPILERGGLRVGVDFFLAYSPEREDPGNGGYDTRAIPKLVAGATDACLSHAMRLYEGAVERVVGVSSLEVAELAKLHENIFRSVNIALVNELKQLCQRMRIDVFEVVEAAATKPFGFMPFFPGPGIGGHCIPVDPFYLTWKARELEFSTKFIELAGEINSSMPRYVVQRTMEELSRRARPLGDARVLVLGLAYKRNVDDVRESPSLRVIELLEAEGCRVAYHDPYVPRTHRMRHHDLQLESVPLSEATVARQDAVVLLTDHDGVDYGMVVRHAPLVVDTRGVMRAYGPRGNVAFA